MRLIITGGGTGGHIYPGLAVARELASRGSHHWILFVGAGKGLETSLVPQEGFEIETLRVAGMKGKGVLQTALSGLLLVAALIQSLVLIRRRKPDVVLGVGGYASGPMGLAAALTRRPLALAEQNASPGMTNRWLGGYAKKVFLSMPGSEHVFPAGVTALVGNPVRPRFFTVERKSGTDRLNALIIGGSQGAASLNRAMAEAAPLLDTIADRLSIVHQTGAAGLDMMKTIYKNARFPWEAEPFFHDMPQRIADADLVISRAGAGALAEICAVGRAAVYVPFPHAADDHQTKNASVAVNKQAAVLIADKELDGKTLAQTIQTFEASRAKLDQMGARAKKLARPDAAAKIVDGLLDLAGEAA